MATLWISEYNKASVHGGAGPMAIEPPLADQTVTFTTSTQSNAFNAKTTFVRLIADANCHVLFGADPTATATNKRLRADSAEYFGVQEGASHKVAVYDGSS